jgi:hypothetical protein
MPSSGFKPEDGFRRATSGGTLPITLRNFFFESLA